jgi:tRNA(adenine34) deaminase
MASISPHDSAMDEAYMRQAIKEAEKALAQGEVPIGCVIVHDGRVIGRGHNRTESLQDPTAHAEMLAITSAAGHMKSWRLLGTTVYCTVEPCAMCAGALVLARVNRLEFGAFDPKFGACGSIFDIVSDPKTNHKIAVTGGLLEEECAAIMREFFKKRRLKEK